MILGGYESINCGIEAGIVRDVRLMTMIFFDLLFFQMCKGETESPQEDD